MPTSNQKSQFMSSSPLVYGKDPSLQSVIGLERRVAISLGGCFEEKEGGGGDQGRWMERKGHSDGNYGRKI